MAGEAEIERMVVRLLGDASHYEKTLKTATQKTESFVRDVGKKMRAVGQSMKALGRSISFRVTAPIVAMGAASILTGANFQKGFMGVRKTVDATAEELAVLRQGFKDMALKIPVADVELLGIGESAGQLGIQTDKILAFTRTIAEMGVSTNLTTEEAATSMARFANITGMSQDEFSNLGSSIVALGNSSATTETEILGMSMRLASSGRNAGLSNAEVLAYASTLSSVGLQAEAGGTAFSKLFTEIRAAVAMGGKELETFAEVSGKTSQQFIADFKGNAARAVQDLLKSLGGMGGDQQIIAIDKLGYAKVVRMLDAIQRMSGAKGLEELEKNLNLSGKSFEENAALAEEAALAFKGFWAQVTLVKNHIKDLLERAFVIMEPTLVKIMDSVKGTVNWFRNLSDKTLRLGITILTVVATIGPLLIFFGGLVGLLGFMVVGVSAAIPIVTSLGAAFVGMGASAATGWALVAGGSVAVSLLLIDVKKLYGEIAESLGPALAILGQEIKDNVVFSIQLLSLEIKALIAVNERFNKVFSPAAYGFEKTAGSVDLMTASVQALIRSWTTFNSLISPMAFLRFLARGKTGQDIAAYFAPPEIFPQQAGLAGRAKALGGGDRMRLGGGVDEFAKSQEEAASLLGTKQAQAQTSAESFVASLMNEANTFGLSARQARIYQMELEGVTRETLEAARAVDQFLTKQERQVLIDENVKGAMSQIEREIVRLSRGYDDLDMALYNFRWSSGASLTEMEKFGAMVEQLRSLREKGAKDQISGPGVSMRAAAQVGTAEAQSRIMAFRSGAGTEADNKRTADGVDNAVKELQGLREDNVRYFGGGIWPNPAGLKK